MTQQHRVTWGDLDLDMAAPHPEHGFQVETMADGTNMGNPVRLVEVVKSLLTDGSLVEQLGFDNREIPIRLRFSAPAAKAGSALEAAERLLSLQTNAEEIPALFYTPSADGGGVCVFDVLSVDLQRDLGDGWDEDETLHEHRYFVLTFSTHPFPRDAEPTVAAALALPTDPGGVVQWTDVDTCDTATGWAAEGNTGDVEPAYDAGTFVETTSSISTPNNYLRLIRTGSIAVPAGRYLAIDVSMEASFAAVDGHWSAYYSGSWHSPAAIAPGIGEDGFTRLYFANVGTISSFKVAFDFTSVGAGAFVRLACSNVAYTDTIGSRTLTTTRQQPRVADVGGSAPTQAAVQLVSRTASGLGDVLIYSSNNSGWYPPLRRLISDSSGTAADAALVSGTYHSLNTAPPTKILIPASQLAAGMYDLVARLSVASAAVLTWTAKMVTAAGATLAPLSDLTVTETIDLAATTGYQILSLNTRPLPLPVRRVGDDQLVELTLSATGGNVQMDEAWLFSRSHGSLTWLQGLGTMKWVEIHPVRLGEDALKHDAGTAATIVGDAVTALTGRFAVDDLARSVALHEWSPGQKYLFTVQTGALTASSWITYYRRFHSHVEAAATVSTG